MPDPRIWPIPAAVDTFATVTALSAVALAANPNRVDADFINTGANWIHLGRGKVAVMGSGEALAPKGGSYHIGIDNLFLGDIYAITDGSEVNLSISEGTKP